MRATWFAVATFLCSGLIFWAEPLVGKQLLPRVGGAPAVWNVCLLFFQCALLGGYAVAHGLSRLRSIRVQVGIYLALAAVAAVTLPVDFSASHVDANRPTLWLLLQLTRALFVPFVALAAAAPILQYWYSRTNAKSAQDPYFLYAASNAGSFIALLAYPFVIEPALAVSAQNRIWAVVFVGGVLTVAGCALYAGRQFLDTGEQPTVASEEKPGRRQIGEWMLLAAIPSSLLLGVTSFVTADLAPVPLLWVLPLALYLMSFIVAFGWMRGGPPTWFGRVIVVSVVAWCALYRLQKNDPALLIVSAHLVMFTLLALGVHARLAQRRPAAAHLTTYYLALAAGGALGGAINTLIAPFVFDTVAEYPIAVLAATMMILYTRGAAFNAKADVIPLIVVLLAIDIGLTMPAKTGLLTQILAVGVPLAIALGISSRPIRFVLALSAIVASGKFDRSLNDRVLYSSRNFYGALRVTTYGTGRYRQLLHGRTLHGSIDGRAPRSEPLNYYWTGSPVADIIRGAQARSDSMRVAVVGLGVGALAWYARPTEQWTFYEINPTVVRLARDPQWFDFLAQSSADSIGVVLGDARIELRNAAAETYDLIILDAFTSDAIPVHILTREAVELYLSKLRPGGALVFHLSNKYLNLRPVVSAVGHSLGLQPFFRNGAVTVEQYSKLAQPSVWMVLVRDVRDFPLGERKDEWQQMSGPEGRVWTDDYSNVWSAFIK